MRGINMSNSEIWKNFLNNIKDEITDISFNIWFNEDDTKLYSFKDDVATIVVNQDFIKKHLEDNYMDIMMEAMYKATNSNVTIKVILEDEVKALEEERKKELKKSMEKDFVNQSSDNANLNPNYTFESFIV